MKAWQEVRDKYKQAKGASFSLREFHERSLKEGPVPLSALAGLLHGGIRPAPPTPPEDEGER